MLRIIPAKLPIYFSHAANHSILTTIVRPNFGLLVTKAATGLNLVLF
jgi:hypothetical protein